MYKITFLYLIVLVMATTQANTRLVILADMGNEPDEEQQMVHMLMCSNAFDLEGLIAVTGKYLHPGRKDPFHQVVHPELFTKLIGGYEKVLPNLKLHAQNWPEPDHLRSIVTGGQSGYGYKDIGEGKSSDGSNLLLKIFEKDDTRPIWIVMNAGSNTLGQALYEYRQSHTQAETDAVIAKLRVFENGAQDNCGAWICSEFPKIHWIRSNYQTYAYGGPGGMDGAVGKGGLDMLGPYYWQPYEYSVVGQNEWLKEHVMNDHGALGQLFPERRWGKHYGFMEGGGPSPGWD